MGIERDTENGYRQDPETKGGGLDAREGHKGQVVDLGGSVYMSPHTIYNNMLIKCIVSRVKQQARQQTPLDFLHRPPLAIAPGNDLPVVAISSH